MNLAELVAIDVHTHAEVSKDGQGPLSPSLFGASKEYFKGHEQPAIPEMAAVVFTVDAEHATGHPRISNEEVAESCAEHSDVLIPFGMVLSTAAPLPSWATRRF